VPQQPDPQPPALLPSRLTADLRRLGLTPGGIVMVHTRMSALGWVVGGSEGVVRALRDALGPEGTLMAYASWEEHVYQAAEWPPEHREAYVAEPPAFDLATSEAVRDHGRVPERVRTWPGARRSAHPEASVVAVGPRAAWLTDPHPDDDAYGADSPFARLVAAGGQVLMLGAPLDTVTLLHHAEAIARLPDKRRVTFRVAVAHDGRVTERTYTDIDTSEGAFPYEDLDLGDEDPFAVIARAALAAGAGVRGRVGEAECHLFDARELTAFAVAWMEERFGAREAGR
jgi:aminoglycoside 3-N-acetyltransferase